MHITHNIFKMEPNSHLTAFNKCILALLFRVDNTSANNTLDKLIDTSSDSLGKITNFDTVFTTLLQNSMLYHYHGSLTTPPCTENVNWYVLERPLPIRTDQLNYIRKYLNSGHDNSRPVQNTNSRPVYRISTECNANMELLSLGSYNFDLKLVLPLLILAVITLI
jgi:carbonic anhydrase